MGNGVLELSNPSNRDLLYCLSSSNVHTALKHIFKYVSFLVLYKYWNLDMWTVPPWLNCFDESFIWMIRKNKLKPSTTHVCLFPWSHTLLQMIVLTYFSFPYTLTGWGSLCVCFACGSLCVVCICVHVFIEKLWCFWWGNIPPHVSL